LHRHEWTMISLLHQGFFVALIFNANPKSRTRFDPLFRGYFIGTTLLGSEQKSKNSSDTHYSVLLFMLSIAKSILLCLEN
jgi:hypothetical protein